MVPAARTQKSPFLQWNEASIGHPWLLTANYQKTFL